MITLIGIRCKASDGFSRDVLIARFPIRNCENHEQAEMLEQRESVIYKNTIPDQSGCVLNRLFWWLNGKVTPLPIPNREVKLASVDDTPCGESR